jgi:hypothetical protein
MHGPAPVLKSSQEHFTAQNDGTVTPPLDNAFSFCSHRPMEELAFKIVKLVGPHDEVVARSSNFLICKAAFEKALFVWPNEHLEMRQGARIILKSKEQS